MPKKIHFKATSGPIIKISKMFHSTPNRNYDDSSAVLPKTPPKTTTTNRPCDTMIIRPLTIKGDKNKALSLRQLSLKSKLDIGALSRAEDKSRIPSFAFFVDWAKYLGTSVEDIVKEARSRID